MQNSTKKASRQHPYIGTTVGQYRIDELLGGGAMGLVFLAHQNSIGRDVAVKFLSYHHKGDELSYKRLEREAQAMGKLNHPGLVSTHEFGTTDYGQPYIVMEYAKGEPLSELINNENRIDIERTVGFTKQLAKAMDYAHRNGVIHRDLKPANIMVSLETGEEHLKIFDFGIARLTQDTQLLTRPGMVMGSPVYMSPEQCKGQDTDARSDIYSLGVIMYFCITGSFPIIGEGGQMTMIHKLSKKPATISCVAPELNIHPALELLVMSMLAIDPILRPQTMSHVVKELDKITEASAYSFEESNVKQLSDFDKITKVHISKDNVAKLFETNSNEPVEFDKTVSYLVSMLLLLVMAIPAIGMFDFNSQQSPSIKNAKKEKIEVVPISVPKKIKAKPDIAHHTTPSKSRKEEAAPAKVANTNNKEKAIKMVKKGSIKNVYPLVRTASVPKQQTPMQKLNSLDPKTRSQIKKELIEYFRKQNFRKRKAKAAERNRRGRKLSSLNNQKLYGKTPYNQIHSRFRH